MDPQKLSNITSLFKQYNRKKTKKGIRVDGPYWFGSWQQNGKRSTVYIGKELPAELKVLLSSRVRVPGNAYFRWPWRQPQA